ncbi:tripartite tricarboxylate transporter permease [Bacillus horti]|uniref:Tricarboxylic transport membrane protein n=1 Tax=Caldalkalibacillus horti TaxID=77523 RepID=A0ABT9VVI2_9BACI|nr:tripartite tricarboxylate transporter permease [Bacillus horti]MDQ0164986.1 putative tricarboxylic transport membrane protein [Bacillus horti]
MLAEAFSNLFQVDVLLICALGVIGGIAIGALPGLTATMGVALLLPLTFGMSHVSGILLLICIYFGAIYGGSISAILLRTPGTPAAAVTTLDGFAMAKEGNAKKALMISTLSSGIGGFISVIILIFLAPVMAGWALQFSAPESFALAFFGLSIITSIAGGSLVKGLITGVVGLIIATVGIDPVSGITRFTFGNVQLLGGLSFIPIMIGLFAASEVFKTMESIHMRDVMKVTVSKIGLKWQEFKMILATILRSTGIGTFIGMIPGAGGDVAAFVSYNEAKRFSKRKEEFGKGSMAGVAAPESSNSATTGGAMIPLLTLGIPGDAVTAVLLGAFMVQGLQPGPLLFQNNGDVVYSLFLGMLLSNMLIIVFGLIGIRYFIKILAIPKEYLTLSILVLCVIGAYALNNNFFDVWVMLISGVIGYFMQRYGYPLSPVILALILGPMAESNLRRALTMSDGSLSIFFTRPIAATLIILAILTLFLPIVRSMLKNRKNKKDSTVST